MADRTTDVIGVLEDVNARQRTSWSLVERLRGGYQSGAFLIADPSGRRAVLKWTASPERAPVVLAAEPVIAAARARGWPTPAWLATGLTRHGWPWEIQELVVGEPQDSVTPAWLDLVLPVIAAQAGLGEEGMRDWSSHDRDVVHLDEGGQQALLARSGAAGDRLVSTVRTVVRPFARVEIPPTDLVHGDLDPGNVLILDGAVVGLVDAEGVGRGSRLHDLADLALHTALWDSDEVHERLVAECRAVARAGWFEVTLCSIAVSLMAFGVRSWPKADLDAACDETRRTLLRLFGERRTDER